MCRYLSLILCTYLLYCTVMLWNCYIDVPKKNCMHVQMLYVYTVCWCTLNTWIQISIKMQSNFLSSEVPCYFCQQNKRNARSNQALLAMRTRDNEFVESVVIRKCDIQLTTAMLGKSSKIWFQLMACNLNYTKADDVSCKFEMYTAQ